MFETLISIITELLTGEKPESPAPARRTGAGGGGVPAANRGGGAAEPQAVTLEDLFRKLTGMPPVEQEAVAPRPAAGQRRVGSEAGRQAADARQVQCQQGARPAVHEGMASRPAASGYKALKQPKREEVQVTRSRSGGLDFVSSLRESPEAARQAFVLSEIFGRPVGER